MTWFYIGGGATLVVTVLGLMWWLVHRAQAQGRAEAVRDGALSAVDDAREAATIRESVNGLSDEELNDRMKKWFPPAG